MSYHNCIYVVILYITCTKKVHDICSTCNGLQQGFLVTYSVLEITFAQELILYVS